MGNATLQQVVPGHIRSAVFAIHSFSLSSATMLRPMPAAMIADRFFQCPRSISDASAIVLPIAMLCVLLLALVSAGPYRRMLTENAAT